MARYALVEDNKAVNIVEWDGDTSISVSYTHLTLPTKA
mgnify:CR=1 FL=1